MSRTYRKQSGDQWWKSKANYTQEYTFPKQVATGFVLLMPNPG